jgi:hypothetical protein
LVDSFESMMMHGLANPKTLFAKILRTKNLLRPEY